MFFSSNFYMHTLSLTNISFYMLWSLHPMHIHCFAIVSQKSLDFNQICKTNCILYIYGLWMCCNGHQLYYKSHSTLLTGSECRRCCCIDLLYILCRTTKECFTTNMSGTSFFLSSNFCSRKPLMLLLMWLQSCHNFMPWPCDIRKFRVL